MHQPFQNSQPFWDDGTLSSFYIWGNRGSKKLNEVQGQLGRDWVRLCRNPLINSCNSSSYPFIDNRETASQGDKVTNLASQNESNPDVGVPGSTEVCAGQRAGHVSPCHLGGTQGQDWGHPQLQSRSLYTFWNTYTQPIFVHILDCELLYSSFNM